MTQAAVFVVLAFAVPWIIAPWLPQQPQTTWEVIASFVPGVWAPTIIALVMLAWTEGLAGLGRRLKRYLRYPFGGGKWVLLAITFPAVVVLAGVAASRASGSSLPFISSTAFWSVLMAASPTGATGEEVGWRGFLLSRLGERLSPPMASLTMAILWTLWHLPIFLFPDSPYYIWPMVPALLTIVSFGFLMGYLFHRTDGSVIPTILAHLSLNVVLAVGGAPLSSRFLWWTTGTIFAATAAALFAWSVRQREVQTIDSIAVGTGTAHRS